jgi:uncharacterized membrane protein YbhN (UPF0104 family)/tRNA A-37 threonylcarbamoyl transferase component Bud32
MSDDAAHLAQMLPSPGLLSQRPSAHGVQIVDSPEVRVHHPSDLVNLVICTFGVALILVMAVYAHGTTSGVLEDVQGVAGLLRQILTVPVAVLEGLVTLVLPAAVLIELSARRLWRQILEALLAGFVGLLVSAAVTWLLLTFGSETLVRGLSVVLKNDWTLTIPGYISAVAGLVTAAGTRGRRRTVAWSWNLLWVALGVVLVTGQVSLPGAAIAVLAGRMAGLSVRFLSGVQSERAYGAVLVDGIRRAGFEPVRLVRAHGEAVTSDAALVWTAEAIATTRIADNRVYDMSTTDDRLLEVVVMDGDRQVIGVLSRLWRSLRLRGIDGRSVVSLRQAAERAALLSYAARAAGVRTPKLLAVAEADESMIFVQEHTTGAVPLRDVDEQTITDDVLRAIWDQIRLAHAAGVAHRALTSDNVLIEGAGSDEPRVWLTNWDFGDVASSDLARRMDLTQMVALLAVRVGARRALASATSVLPIDDIAAIGPMLQTIALPRRTRDEIRVRKHVLAELRTALVEQLPEASVEPERLVRLGARTILTVILTTVAAVVILTSINVSVISTALANSDWRWSVVAFALGLLTLVGAALAFVAYSPIALPVWRTVLVQTAATFVALAAPAGVGPAALNLRMLTRRGVSTSLAVATVALVQVSQFAVTIVLLMVLSIASGTNEAAKFAPSTGTLVVIAVLLGLAAAAFLVPWVRRWVLAKTLPTLRHTGPRLIAILGQPGRLALGLGGNVVMTMGYVLALDAALAAFGQQLSLVQVAIIYLGGNAAGAVLPTPGGLGSIDVALITLLGTVGGINFGVATSVAVLFRVVTFWLRIPLGWVAMRVLQRTGEL